MVRIATMLKCWLLCFLGWAKGTESSAARKWKMKLLYAMAMSHILPLSPGALTCHPYTLIVALPVSSKKEVMLSLWLLPWYPTIPAVNVPECNTRLKWSLLRFDCQVRIWYSFWSISVRLLPWLLTYCFCSLCHLHFHFQADDWKDFILPPTNSPTGC